MDHCLDYGLIYSINKKVKLFSKMHLGSNSIDKPGISELFWHYGKRNTWADTVDYMNETVYHLCQYCDLYERNSFPLG